MGGENYDAVGGDVVRLDLIVLQHGAEKAARRKRESSFHQGLRHHPLARLRFWLGFVRHELPLQFRLDNTSARLAIADVMGLTVWRFVGECKIRDDFVFLRLRSGFGPLGPER